MNSRSRAESNFLARGEDGGVGLMVWAVLGVLVALAVACSADKQETGRPLAVGDAAPAFALPGADGVIVSLAEQLEDAPVLLYFHMGFG